MILFTFTNVEIDTYIPKIESVFWPKVKWMYGTGNVEPNIPA